ncbi:VOC family protein [Bacillus manliponensis]|uniref:VOC family protein n=1 Tax=Bacillus manliponensis TaxID=574376 RepID=UPI0035151DFE
MEFYPMPMFVKLSVKDMTRSLQWYKNVLQFESVLELPNDKGEIVMAHIRGEKYQDILLLLEACNKGEGNGIVLNFTVNDVNSFFENARNHKANITEGPTNRAWNARELVLADPDGYVITLSMQIDNEKTMNDIVSGL